MVIDVDNNSDNLQTSINRAHWLCARGELESMSLICNDLLNSSNQTLREYGIYLYALHQNRVDRRILPILLGEMQSPQLWCAVMGLYSQLVYGHPAPLEKKNRSLLFDTGGWWDPRRFSDREGSDQVAVTDDTQQFQEAVVRQACPGILRNIGNTWKARKDLSMLSFARDYGTEIIIFPNAQRKVTIDEYVIDMLGHSVRPCLPRLKIPPSGLGSKIVFRGLYEKPDIGIETSWFGDSLEDQGVVFSPVGTRYPLSNNMLTFDVAIHGIREWWAFPPSMAWLILANSWSGRDDNAKPWSKEFDKAVKETQTYRFCQCPGDLVFIPPGWITAHHALTPTITVSWTARASSQVELLS